MKDVLMLSGGADSTALLNYMLVKTEEELTVHHIDFSMPDDEGMDANRARHNRKAQAQETVVDWLVAYFQEIRPFAFERSEVRIPPAFHLHPRRWYTTIGASAVIEHDAAHLLTGDNRHTTMNDNLVYCAPFYATMFDAIMGIGRSRVDEDKVVSSKYVKARHQATWRRPLAELGWSKQQIVRSIPQEIRRLVVHCDYPTVYPDHWERCGECFQCRRFERHGGLE